MLLYPISPQHALKNLLPGATQHEHYIKKIPPHPPIIPGLFLFLDAYYYSQNYSDIMFAGLAGTYPRVVILIMAAVREQYNKISKKRDLVKVQST